MALGTAVGVYQQFYPLAKSDLATSSHQLTEPLILTVLKCFSIDINGRKVNIMLD